MRMIPPQPHSGATNSEMKVFRLLSQASFGKDAYALSSLNLAEHEYQRWGEIDYVLVTPSGILVIEVKGGDVDCTNGVWRFGNRRGQTVNKSISPIAQAQAAFSSMLKHYLNPALPEVISKATSGFCALFPAADRQSIAHLIGGPEMPVDLIGTKEDCANPASLHAFVTRVTLYWAQHKKKRTAQLNGDEVRKLVATLRPSFDRVAPLALSLRRVRDEQLSLTMDQYRLLDFLESNERILCTGAAGSGKTFIAMEALRRECGANPALITGTDTLAGHLRASHPAQSDRIFSYAELDARRGGLTGAFSTLIIDEGQQITSRSAVDLFSEVIGKPFDKGRWRWFADPNFQVSSTSHFHPELHAELETWALAKATLPDNCRNTPQIIHAVEFLSGSPIGSTRVKGKGPDVEYAKDAGADKVISAAGKRIKEWVEKDEIAPGDIILLSMLPLARSTIPDIARAAGLDFANWRAGWDQQKNYPQVLGASTIEAFRGIEAPAVVLCDISGSIDEIRQAFYLGMTRANFGMFVAADPETLAGFMQQRLQLTQVGH